MTPHFENGNNFRMLLAGYVRRRGVFAFWRKYRIAIFNVVTLRPCPRWVTSSGMVLGTRRFMPATDFGSIPPDLQAIGGDNTSFVLPYIFHDDCVRNGGLYLRLTSGNWVFLPITRVDADRMLRQWVRADDGSWREAETVRWGAGIGTVVSWVCDRLRPRQERVVSCGR